MHISRDISLALTLRHKRIQRRFATAYIISACRKETAEWAKTTVVWVMQADRGCCSSTSRISKTPQPRTSARFSHYHPTHPPHHPPTAVCNTTLSCDRINGCLGRPTCICVARNSNSVGESRLTCNREGRRGACYIDTLSLGLALLLLGNYSIYKNSFLPTRLLIDGNYWNALFSPSVPDQCDGVRHCNGH